MTHEKIIVRGARTHNLKNISLEIPRNRIVVFTGVSGSGKSSLVFDTIYTEAQRQLIETFSSFARRFLPKLSKPDVEEIRNLSTAIIIDQKKMGTTMRSTVGTTTEIYTYLRLLFSRCGTPFIGPSFVFGFNHPLGMCPDCSGLGKRISADVKKLLDREKTIRGGAVRHPDYKIGGWMWRELVGSGLFDPDKAVKDFSKQEIEDLLYAEAIPISSRHGESVYSKNFAGIARRLEKHYKDKAKEEQSDEDKNVYDRYFIYSDCPSCGGTRINEKARSVKLNGFTLPELVNLELADLYSYLETIEGEIAGPVVAKMKRILSHLIEIGVGYLSLNRSVATLSGGESQRVKMARQLDCDLVDLTYIMDEPSIGLHPKDTRRLIGMLEKLRDKGNSVLVVEHDPDIIKSADWLVDIGPGAGDKGGEIVFSGTTDGLKNSNGLTAGFLFKTRKEEYRRKAWKDFYDVSNARVHNLKNISVKIPKGVLTCVTGVAGSGKSSLIHDVFIVENKNAVLIDQSAIGKSSRSNPATYIGFFDSVRKEFAGATGAGPSLFSFNSEGACPKCSGLGTVSYEMNFLDEVRVTCDECLGKRYTENVLNLRYKGKNIDDVLNMTAEEGLGFFSVPDILKKLQVLCDVGLEYLEIGQPLSSLSGGEAQRIKLASELHREGNIYVMDEPTTGLHMADIEKFLKIIKKLVNHNNTVVVIEHNLDIIRHADWIIDMGPEGGMKGGEVIFEGIPEDLVRCDKSHTGRYLREVLS